jgi:hypothetical protein
MTIKLPPPKRTDRFPSGGKNTGLRIEPDNNERWRVTGEVLQTKAPFLN